MIDSTYKINAVKIEDRFYIKCLLKLPNNFTMALYLNTQTLVWYPRSLLKDASAFNDYPRVNKYVINFCNNIIGLVVDD